ncbi:hypothetical protein FA13DRAFT_1742431 [Coprinellus micaceus]|uniref:Uncharacterized protein n=1 Tax=Coprinellus micaceus TaxID=71717 RepID=A0A4Y7SGP5_COPMI|nr:hypothetical protein FA13DRAFT_1742431 [Coprinellus micaceus]
MVKSEGRGDAGIKSKSKDENTDHGTSMGCNGCSGWLNRDFARYLEGVGCECEDTKNQVWGLRHRYSG